MKSHPFPTFGKYGIILALLPDDFGSPRTVGGSQEALADPGDFKIDLFGVFVREDPAFETEIFDFIQYGNIRFHLRGKDRFDHLSPRVIWMFPIMAPPDCHAICAAIRRALMIARSSSI